MNQRSKYEIFQYQLNDLLSIIIDKNENVIVSGVESILDFQEKLSNIISKEQTNSSYLEKFKSNALNLITELNAVKEIDYSEIVQCLQKWCENDNDKIGRDELIEK